MTLLIARILYCLLAIAAAVYAVESCARQNGMAADEFDTAPAVPGDYCKPIWLVTHRVPQVAVD